MLLNDKKGSGGCKRRALITLRTTLLFHDKTCEKVYTSLPYVYSLYPHVGVDVFY